MSSEYVTQIRRMLAFAESNGSITNADAIYYLGVLSPTRRVCDIRKLGYAVSKTAEYITDKFGVRKRIVRYKFTKEAAR